MYPINYFLFSSSSWFTGRRPEFTDPRVVAQGEGREGKSLEAPDCNPCMTAGHSLAIPLLLKKRLVVPAENSPAWIREEFNHPKTSLNQFYSRLLSSSNKGALSRLCDHFLQRSDQRYEEVGLRREPERHAEPFSGACYRRDS